MSDIEFYTDWKLDYGVYWNTGLAAVMTEDQKKRRKAGLDETRQLTRPAGYYLTDLEGSKCEILDHADINFTPFRHQNVGAKYREICEGVDNEQA